MEDIMKLQGAVVLMRDIHNSRLSKEEKLELLDQIVAEILNMLPAHIYTVRISEDLYGETEEVLPSQIWDLDQIDRLLVKMKHNIGL